MKTNQGLLTKKQTKTQFHSAAAPARMTRALDHLLARHAGLWAALGLLAALAFRPPPTQAAVSEVWVHRYDGPGNQQWEDQARAVAVDGSGNVVVTGCSYSTNFNIDYYTAKYAAADGALLWEQRYNGLANKDDRAQAVAVDGSGNVVVTGNNVTIKYLANGTEVWINYPGAIALALDGSGNVVVVAWEANGDYSFDYYTAKYAAADGTLLWEQRYNGPGNYNDFANAVAVDSNGNVVVTGSSQGDYYTAKYAAADGALLWETRYNGPANGDDIVAGLALGPNGMVAVTGSSSGDYATVVYRDDVYPISIALVPTGIRLRFTGIPGRGYTVERAPAVTGPWTPIHTQTAPASSLLEYLDAPPPPGSAFYRTVQP